jgi:hypothetical protein
VEGIPSKWHSKFISPAKNGIFLVDKDRVVKNTTIEFGDEFEPFLIFSGFGAWLEKP